MNINLILIIISIVWLSILTGIITWLFLNLKGLLKGIKGGDFLEVFKSTQEVQKLNSDEIGRLSLQLKRIEKDMLSNVQNIGLVKYNPFNESGGDHSFSLVLLDGNKNGIIITSLHTRERTRLYTKVVKSGICAIELSKEETKALSQALT